MKYQDRLREELAAPDDVHPRALSGVLARVPAGLAFDRKRGGTLLSTNSRMYLR